MALLADNTNENRAYDPAGAVSKSCASLLPLTVIDAVNLRRTFTTPASFSGNVLVRMRCQLHGAASSPMILLGVLENSPNAGTVRGRMAPFPWAGSSAGTQRQIRETEYVVTGLASNTTYVWDAAYAVQVTNASTQIKYGGPNDSGLDNTFGAFVFEVHDASNLLAGKCYDPATTVSIATDTQIPLTALDTLDPNGASHPLRLTFNAPASGRTFVKLDTLVSGATGTRPQVLLGVLDGTTPRGRLAGGSITSQLGAGAATDFLHQSAAYTVSGLTGGASYTWDAAYAVKLVLASSAIKYGGPNDNLGADAFGGFAYSIWAA